MSADPTGPVLDLVGEFGHVRLQVDHCGNGPRLRVEVVTSGVVGYLDPLELESWLFASWDLRADIVDPIQRWI